MFIFLGRMQRILSVARTLTSLVHLQNKQSIQQSFFSTIQKPGVNLESWLTPFSPVINLSCGFKVKGHVRRRCKSCYIVIRDERVYNICPKYPRHKQMSMKPKPHNTWILTHATQSRVRPWQDMQVWNLFLMFQLNKQNIYVKCFIILDYPFQHNHSQNELLTINLYIYNKVIYQKHLLELHYIS